MIQTYSTSEIKTAAKWIDGKTIYKKVIPVSSLPKTTSSDYSLGVNTGVIVKLEGFTKLGDVTLPLPYAAVNATSTIALYSNKANYFTIATGTDRSALSGYVVAYYTKK